MSERRSRLWDIGALLGKRIDKVEDVRALGLPPDLTADLGTIAALDRVIDYIKLQQLNESDLPVKLKENEGGGRDVFDCKRCAAPIRFIQSDRKGGGKCFKPTNLDGSDHFQTCDRSHLFGRSIVRCKGCECNLERDAGEWQAGNYYDFSKNDWVNGRWFPDPSFRVLSCPACGWFYQWDADRDGFEFPDVETILLKLDFDGWLKLKYGALVIVSKSKARANLPTP